MSFPLGYSFLNYLIIYFYFYLILMCRGLRDAVRMSREGWGDPVRILEGVPPRGAASRAPTLGNFIWGTLRASGQ